uniref:Alpha/beta hydrolase n=1 Tax=Paulinella chromatophora TaxID=39717 RepID=B1X403_PAUCH|nr:hypothetical protein PCC_0222 [Paulinella chromatophora]ACB42672.1 hypothetical protein PCC_0222 [Paulinella chromatophora]
MYRWEQRGNLWCLNPSRPLGIVEMIGGGYLAARPQISYRFLLEELAAAGLVIRAWSYVPSLDHQGQAIAAWHSFQHEAKRSGPLNYQISRRPIRLGHSLGCKLHLLAPDYGRDCSALLAVSFNNFSINRSIPMWNILTARLGLRTEFNPSPLETLRLIKEKYVNPHNLVVRFNNDKFDQSYRLLETLQNRPNDRSQILVQQGSHLTPTSLGINDYGHNSWASDYLQRQQIGNFTKKLINWWEQNAC